MSTNTSSGLYNFHVLSITDEKSDGKPRIVPRSTPRAMIRPLFLFLLHVSVQIGWPIERPSPKKGTLYLESCLCSTLVLSFATE